MSQITPLTELVTEELILEAEGLDYDSTTNCTIAYGMGLLDGLAGRKRPNRSVLTFIAAVELGTQMVPDFESAREMDFSVLDDVNEMHLEAYLEGYNTMAR